MLTRTLRSWDTAPSAVQASPRVTLTGAARRQAPSADEETDQCPDHTAHKAWKREGTVDV